MPIIAISNQKGGVGKTTSTLNLAAALQEFGKRVLMIDLDPQGSLSVAAGLLDIDRVQVSIGDLLLAYTEGRPVGLHEAIVRTSAGLDIVSGNAMLGAAELALAGAPARESALAGTLLPALETYDYVLIDCLPSLGLMAINALRAASGVVIPVGAEFLAVHGLGQILETIDAVRRQLNPNLKVRLFHSGPGTFWTNMGDKNMNLLFPMPGSGTGEKVVAPVKPVVGPNIADKGTDKK